MQVTLAVDFDMAFHGALAGPAKPFAHGDPHGAAVIVGRKRLIPAGGGQNPVVAAVFQAGGSLVQVQFVAGSQPDIRSPVAVGVFHP